jgi:predicted permease
MLRRLRRLLDSIFRRHRLEGELDEELRSNFQMMVERLISRGMTPEDARRAAQLEFQGLEQVKESVRDGWIGSGLLAFLYDIRYACRGLRRRPSFAIVVLITLALGVGVNTAVFSVFYSVLMRGLPYRDPEGLVLIWANLRTRGTANVAVSGEIVSEILQRQRSMADIAGVWVTPPLTFPGDPPQQVKAAVVSPNFFDLLGVSAAAGRTFVRGDADQPSLILADTFFRRRFGSDPNVLGKTMNDARGGMPIGVLPPHFALHFAPEANVPGDVEVFQAYGPDFLMSKNYIIRLVARLSPGVTRKTAQSDFDRIAKEIRDGNTEFAREDLHFTIAGMQADAFHDVRPALTALFAGGGFVLLICCVNIASLLLARANDRRQEVALRLALGASRGRILVQLISEAVILCAVGGAAGAGIGWSVFYALAAIRPERLSRIDEGGLLWPLVVFSALASLGAAVIFALAPWFETSRMDCAEALRTKGRVWINRMQRLAGRALVVAEFAIAFILVTGAMLSARTLSNIEQIRPGFDARQLLAFQLPGMQPALLDEWATRFAALPGVTAVGAVSHLPFDTTVGNWYGEYRVTNAGRGLSYTADSRAVTTGYLPAMEIRLKEGRYFGPQDRAGAPFVVIVDESLAKSTWPGESAIGKTIEAEHMTPTGHPFELVPSVVIGVVEHVRTHSLTHEIRPQIYSPFAQNTRGGFPQSFILRTSVPPLSLIPAVRTALRAKNPNMAIDKARAMTDYLDREIAPAGFTAVLAMIFGTLAVLLAATGIYGVLNYHVSRRMPEMGIRMALGAGVRDVLALILREALVVSLIGVVLGMLGAQAAAHWLSSLLYGITPTDIPSYAFALLLLPAAALLGCWRPASRAASANPAETIRQE